MFISELRLGKFIATGVQGAVHKVYDADGKRYAMKIIRINDDGHDIDFDTSTYREVEFAETICNKYPNSFMTLYAHDFIKNANDFDYEKPVHVPNNISHNKKLNSRFAIRLVYTYVDDTLENLIYKLSKKELYSIIVQFVYSINIMRKNGYVHNDLRTKNVGVIRTDEKYIELDENLKIETHGYIFKLIDFGRVLHKKYDLTKSEKEIYKNRINKEIDFIIYNLYRCYFKDKFFNRKIYEITKSDIDRNLFRDVRHYTKDPIYRYFLLAIMYPKQYQRIRSKEEHHDVKLLISFKHILYFIKQDRDADKIIKYFSSLI